MRAAARIVWSYWSRFVESQVVGRHNIWSLVARSHQNSPMTDLDWSEMEGLFCQQAPAAPASQNGVMNFRIGQDASECDRKRKEPTEVRWLIVIIWTNFTSTSRSRLFSISDRFIGRKTEFECEYFFETIPEVRRFCRWRARLRGRRRIISSYGFGFQLERRHHSIDTRWRSRRYRRGKTSRLVENPAGTGRVRNAQSFWRRQDQIGKRREIPVATDRHSQVRPITLYRSAFDDFFFFFSPLSHDYPYGCFRKFLFPVTSCASKVCY